MPHADIIIQAQGKIKPFNLLLAEYFDITEAKPLCLLSQIAVCLLLLNANLRGLTREE